MISPMTAAEHDQGYTVCPCGKFAHVFRAEVLRKLPRDYSGELCPECKLWMVSVEKLREAGMASEPGAGGE